MMLDDLLAARFDNPEQGDSASASGSSNRPDEKVIEIVKWLVEFNGLDQ